jgi:rubrerythrin
MRRNQVEAEQQQQGQELVPSVEKRRSQLRVREKIAFMIELLDTTKEFYEQIAAITNEKKLLHF